MTIKEYFTLAKEEQQHWQNEINKGDWKAAQFLYELLSNDELRKHCGETTRLFLLTDGEKLVSFCTLAERDEIDADDMTPWIGFVYTFPEYRGNRYSETVIKHALSIAENEGSKQVYLSTNEIGLYEKYGFEFLKNMQDIWGGKTQVLVYKLKNEI